LQNFSKLAFNDLFIQECFNVSVFLSQSCVINCLPLVFTHKTLFLWFIQTMW